jgi:hypothetical protein
LSDEDIDEDLLYAVMKSYVLTPQQLEDNGFPLPDPQVSTPPTTTMLRGSGMVFIPDPRSS